MNSLTQINELLDNHFHKKFVSEEEHEHGWKDYDNLEEAIDYLDEEFDEFYNSDEDWAFDICEIKEMCDFDDIMQIEEFLNKYVPELVKPINRRWMKNWTGPACLCCQEDLDTILKAYVYYYMYENHKPKALETIEKFFWEDKKYDTKIGEEEQAKQVYRCVECGVNVVDINEDSCMSCIGKYIQDELKDFVM